MIIELSEEPETINLLSFVKTTFHTNEVCPFNTASCVLFRKFHILIVWSSEPETMYLLSVVAAKLITLQVCPSKTVSCVC